MKKILTMIFGILTIIFISLFIISYFYSWNSQDYLPRKTFENKTMIILHIDEEEKGEWFHRVYSKDYDPTNNPFDRYTYEGNDYPVMDVTASSGCFWDAKFWERCDWFIYLSKDNP